MTMRIKVALLHTMVILMIAVSVVIPLRRIEAAIAYNNTLYATLNCSIDSSGMLGTALDAKGIQGTTTQISVELYVEKRILGVFWKKVDIGCTNNIWTDSTAGYTYSNILSFQLYSTGTYRVTVTYTVSGTGGTPDVITARKTATY